MGGGVRVIAPHPIPGFGWVVCALMDICGSGVWWLCVVVGVWGMVEGRSVNVAVAQPGGERALRGIAPTPSQDLVGLFLRNFLASVITG